VYTNVMRFLFVMDAYASMLPDKDTSFAFMRAAAQRGHECFHALVQDVGLDGRRVVTRCRGIVVSDTAPHVAAGQDERREVSDFDAVFIRKDPPFDSAYLHLTQILDLLDGKSFVMNSPTGLRRANEKLFTFQFYEFMPETMVSADTEQLLAFVKQVGGSAVVKPLDGAGGAGVMALDGGVRSSRGIIDYVTREGRELALVQKYQPDVVNGDKRVLLLNGELLGAIRRVPRADDIRANIHVGGRVEACELDAQELDLVRAVGPKLAVAGLYFVGLDLIGGKLIEVNVTSPTGIQQLGRLTGSQPEQRVIEFTEQQVRARRSNEAKS
jgi:glutathione synthase